MTKPMCFHEEYKRLEKLHNRISVLNDVIDSTGEAITILTTTVAVFVLLKIGGVI